MPSNDEHQGEPAALRAKPNDTFRATVPALEEILYQSFEVLDHGFIRVIDYMGDDAAVVQAARVSYGKGTKKTSEDAGLINYLMRHRHTTPFEMCEIKFHVKLPIFVARQWIRHRTASVNEQSARYSILDNEFYIPSPEDLATQSSTNRQGRSEILTPKQAEQVRFWLMADAGRVHQSYEHNLNDDGTGKLKDPSRPMLARELARIGLSLNFYTQWYWKVNLHNLCNFLSLRADSHAQKEIQVYAEKILDILKLWVPLTHKAFLEYRKNALTLSATATEVMKQILAGKNVTQKESGLGKSEWAELIEKFGLPQN